MHESVPDEYKPAVWPAETLTSKLETVLLLVSLGDRSQRMRTPEGSAESADYLHLRFSQGRRVRTSILQRPRVLFLSAMCRDPILALDRSSINNNVSSINNMES